MTNFRAGVQQAVGGETQTDDREQLRAAGHRDSNESYRDHQFTQPSDDHQVIHPYPKYGIPLVGKAAPVGCEGNSFGGCQQEKDDGRARQNYLRDVIGNTRSHCHVLKRLAKWHIAKIGGKLSSPPRTHAMSPLMRSALRVTVLCHIRWVMIRFR